MCAALGGRAAEEIVFGEVSTGALSDLEKVTKQAYAMVSVYGLNDKIGNISFYDSSGQSEYSFNKPYSEKTAEVIDQEVKSIIDGAYVRTLKILRENREHLNKLAELLLDKEVIFKEDMEAIFGKRKFNKEEEPLIHNEDDSPESDSGQSQSENQETRLEEEKPNAVSGEVKNEESETKTDIDTSA
jgi:cell division protease FtsH